MLKYQNATKLYSIIRGYSYVLKWLLSLRTETQLTENTFSGDGKWHHYPYFLQDYISRKRFEFISVMKPLSNVSHIIKSEVILPPILDFNLILTSSYSFFSLFLFRSWGREMLQMDYQTKECLKFTLSFQPHIELKS